MCYWTIYNKNCLEQEETQTGIRKQQKLMIQR